MKHLSLSEKLILVLSIYVVLELYISSIYQFSKPTLVLFERIDFAICLIFLTDFFYYLYKSENKKVVKNSDLWKELDELVQNFSIEWKWVRGHSGHPGNEKADQLANEAILEFYDGNSYPKRRVITGGNVPKSG